MEVLAIFTKALLDRGIDFEVTLDLSGVHLRLLDMSSGISIGESTGPTLEEALANSVANVVSSAPINYNF